MAFYNPNKIDFNPNSMVIEKIGSVGKTLYDIYQDNVTRAQEQAKINEAITHNRNTEAETNRSNLATEHLKGLETDARVKNYYSQISDRDIDNEREDKKFNWSMYDDNRKFGLDSQYKNALVHNMGVDNNLAAQRLEFDRQKFLAEQTEKAKKAQEAASIEAGITIKKRQPTQKERESIAAKASLAEQLLATKKNFTGGEQGLAQNILHAGAKFFGWQDGETQNFKNQLEYARQTAKALIAGGKISNMQYQDFLKVMPRANEWSDTSYKINHDSALNKLIAETTAELNALENSGIDTTELRQQSAQTLKNIHDQGFFNPELREYDENGNFILPQNPNTKPDIAEAFKVKQQQTQDKNYVDPAALNIKFR